MAKVSNKTALLLLLSLFFIVSIAESFHLPGIGILKPKPALHCDTIYGVRDGDSCFGITQTFKISAELFNSFNPNINCDTLFAGQWVCLAASSN